MRNKNALYSGAVELDCVPTNYSGLRCRSKADDSPIALLSAQVTTNILLGLSKCIDIPITNIREVEFSDRLRDSGSPITHVGTLLPVD